MRRAWRTALSNVHVDELLSSTCAGVLQKTGVAVPSDATAWRTSSLAPNTILEDLCPLSSNFNRVGDHASVDVSRKSAQPLLYFHDGADEAPDDSFARWPRLKRELLEGQVKCHLNGHLSVHDFVFGNFSPSVHSQYTTPVCVVSSDPSVGLFLRHMCPRIPEDSPEVGYQRGISVFYVPNLEFIEAPHLIDEMDHPAPTLWLPGEAQSENFVHIMNNHQRRAIVTGEPVEILHAVTYLAALEMFWEKGSLVMGCDTIWDNNDHRYVLFGVPMTDPAGVRRHNWLHGGHSHVWTPDTFTAAFSGTTTEMEKDQFVNAVYTDIIHECDTHKYHTQPLPLYRGSRTVRPQGSNQGDDTPQAADSMASFVPSPPTGSSYRHNVWSDMDDVTFVFLGQSGGTLSMDAAADMFADMHSVYPYKVAEPAAMADRFKELVKGARGAKFVATPGYSLDEAVSRPVPLA